jgi:hypothetical protein
MVSLRRLRTKSTEREPEDDFDNYAHQKVVNFRPHCYVQEMALAQAKQFDEIYAIAHTPLLGENEDE